MASYGATSAEIGGEYKTAKTSVWWDLEDCQVPKGYDVSVIAENIKTALLKMNYCGPVSMSVYADTTRVPPMMRQDFESTGISICHVPAGVKDARDKTVLVDMLFWAIDNPAPANYLLICEEKGFFDALDQLRMRRYNVLLARPPNASVAVFPAAETVWHWTSLLSGGLPFTNPEKAPQTHIKTAPQESFRVCKPVIPIPDLSPWPRNISDMFENIESFNAIRQQQNLYLQEQKARNEQDDEDGMGGAQGWQPTSEYNGLLVGAVINALYYLKDEKMIPTKENIQDCIRYSFPDIGDIDVDEALKCALEHDMIVSQNLGEQCLYVTRYGDLWDCVNPEAGNPDQYSNATWDAVKDFLTSPDGLKIYLSRCRYEAGLILKNSCLRHICLGRVLQILNMIIVDKEWIMLIDPVEWLPIIIA